MDPLAADQIRWRLMETNGSPFFYYGSIVTARTRRSTDVLVLVLDRVELEPWGCDHDATYEIHASDRATRTRRPILFYWETIDCVTGRQNNSAD
jgi:hypothetical protein